MDGIHWNCFEIKDKKSHYFDSLGNQHDNLFLNQLSKPILYQYYKTQGTNFNLCGFFSLSFFHLTEKMNFYGTNSKMHFG